MSKTLLAFTLIFLFAVGGIDLFCCIASAKPKDDIFWTGGCVMVWKNGAPVTFKNSELGLKKDGSVVWRTIEVAPEPEKVKDIGTELLGI